MRVFVEESHKSVVEELIAALNAIEIPEGCEVIALNFELPSDGSVPAMIELIQPGMEIVGRDGRQWINDKPQAVVDALNATGVDLVIDFEHATELKAPNGEKAPAAGWVNGFEVRDGGAVWGEASWTPAGQEAVANQEYRYLSPVLLFEKISKRIRSLSSIGLVNKPNLFNTALNRQQTPAEEVKPMLKKLLAKLGLAESATEEQALNALGTLQTDLQTALNRSETPSLDKFVPRDDYKLMETRALNAEQKLADGVKAELETAINAEIDAALKAGKITPATKDYHIAMCRQEGGLESFKTYVAAAPVVGDPSDLGGKDPGDGGKAMNAEEQNIADQFGNSAEDLKKYGQA